MAFFRRRGTVLTLCMMAAARFVCPLQKDSLRYNQLVDAESAPKLDVKADAAIRMSVRLKTKLQQMVDGFPIYPELVRAWALHNPIRPHPKPVPYTRLPHHLSGLHVARSMNESEDASGMACSTYKHLRCRQLLWCTC